MLRLSSSSEGGKGKKKRTGKNPRNSKAHLDGQVVSMNKECYIERQQF